MKRSTAMNIFKGMLIAILILALGLVIAINMYVSANERTKQARDACNASEERVEQRIEELDTEYKQQLEAIQNTYEGFSLEYAGEFKLTAYCVEKYYHICGLGHGITSSGQPVQADVSVAVGDLEKFPYGTVLYIEGVGIRIVQDKGDWVKEDQIDIAMDTHENAWRWGERYDRKVYILKVGGGA